MKTVYMENLESIYDRANNMGIVAKNKPQLLMDMMQASQQFHLKVESLANAEDSDFKYDVIGIQKNILRESGKIINFTPMFATK